MSNSKFNYIYKIFTSLKKESYIKRKNLASMNNIAKESNTSRNNFYEQARKFDNWKKLVQEIKDFKNEFDNFLKSSNINSKEEKRIIELSKELKIQMEQNLELLNEINYINDEIKEKNSIIEHLQNRIQTLIQINYNEEKNEKRL